MKREVEVLCSDPKLATRLLSNPIKNKTLQYIWLTTLDNTKCVWMLIDGATER